ncbi:ABC transporter substrate-binding protein [Leucobacter sp. CSA1]|uniref:ABC transporter substrate-binding protein n=1 Tax=Leucobacter chromiisoli TaxID=2796471 RepID=A0A934Q646_9MICO|nr:ABC transporter substrate-binding protein [Leucobacter chromiisoli]MBK0419070.1 ABC transporter substrate-binding protein [Leucobacter chromiisoli]
MSKKTRIIGALAAVGLALGVSACSGGASAGGDSGGSGSTDAPIKFEWGMATGSYLATYIALDKGYFADEGLDPNIQVFQSGAPMLAAFESDSLDVGTVGLATVFALGKDIDIRYFGLEGDASAASGLVAREGSSIQSLEDLANGSPVGVPTGTCAMVSAYYAAESIGAEFNDMNVVDVVPNLYANSFESNSIEAGFSWSPFIVDLEDAGSEIIGWDAEWVPGGGSCPETQFGRGDFLDEHPEVPEKMLRALDRAWADIRADRSIAVDALVERLSVSRETAVDVVDRYVDAQPELADLLDPSNRFAFVGDEGLVAQLEVASDAFAALDVIEAPIPLERLQSAVDSSAIEAVVNGE